MSFHFSINFHSFPDINDCKQSSCLNGGVCVDGINSFTCNCAHGFIGNDCSSSMGHYVFKIRIRYQLVGYNYLSCVFLIFIDINDCMGEPCNNGGTCTDGIATYTCTCPDGFTGRDCETSMIIFLFTFHFR